MIDTSKIIERLENDFPDKTFLFMNDVLIINGKFKLKLTIDKSIEDLKKFHGINPSSEVYKTIKNEILNIG